MLGIAVAGIAVIAMPLLALGKFRANRLIGSASLRADIAETITCAYMAGVTLLGVAGRLAKPCENAGSYVAVTTGLPKLRF